MRFKKFARAMVRVSEVSGAQEAGQEEEEVGRREEVVMERSGNHETHLHKVGAFSAFVNHAWTVVAAFVPAVSLLPNTSNSIKSPFTVTDCH